MKTYKIRIIHMSHTDIGYKNTQQKIILGQLENLLDVVDNIANKKELVWNIESFGILDAFIDKYPEKVTKLVQLVKSKKIGISCNFWNFTKIASPFIIRRSFERIKQFLDKHGLNENNSMITNDINGYAQKWAEAAFDNGVENLFFGLHWSHGYYPGWKKMEPFWWDLGNNKKVFVFMGEQYAFGNNMGIVPGPISDYISSDGLTSGIDEADQMELSRKRISNLIESLQKTGYSSHIIPITVLGTGADNDPINYDIPDRITKLKAAWKELGISDIKMVTLNDFFQEYKAAMDTKAVATYRGEWPDWWADGAASNPFALKLFKQAQREYEKYWMISKKTDKLVENNLLLYSEHTYGTEWSTFKPWSLYTKTVEHLKRNMPLLALDRTNYLLDNFLNWKNPKMRNEKIIKIRVKNLFNVAVDKRVNLKEYIGFSEHMVLPNMHLHIEDQNHNLINYDFAITQHPINPSWSEKDLVLYIHLLPLEEKIIKIDLHKSKKIVKQISSQYETVLGGMPDDIVNIKNLKTGISYIDNQLTSKHTTIIFNEQGIAKINYLGKDISFAESPFKLFTFVDEQHNNYINQYNSRLKMGRNIISKDSICHNEKFISKEIQISKDKLNAKIILNYGLRGTGYIKKIMEISMHDPLINISVQMLKYPNWSNETMFLDMPNINHKFDYGALYQVNKGQIDGSLINYHSIMEGVSYDDFLINHKDTSLLYNGHINFANMRLAQDPKIDDQALKRHAAILLTNNWETNFSVDQGGFHSFEFIISPPTNNNQIDALKANATKLVIERIE